MATKITGIEVVIYEAGSGRPVLAVAREIHSGAVLAVRQAPTYAEAEDKVPEAYEAAKITQAAGRRLA